MKKVVITSLIVMMVAGSTWALEGSDGKKLTGKHVTLNIIAVQNPKTADMDSDHGIGGTIFVNLEGKSKIGLIESTEAGLEADEYAVLDKNATDGDGALLALPDPGLEPYVVGEEYPEGEEPDTMSDYSIYVRPLGKPGGWATITTCADVLNSPLVEFLSPKILKGILNDPGGFGGYASVEQVGQDVTFRNKGKTSFTNVTAELLTIVLKLTVEIDGVETIIYVRVPIFDPILQNEYWEFEQGVDPDTDELQPLKHLQVRIYPWGTDVSEDDGTWNNEPDPEP